MDPLSPSTPSTTRIPARWYYLQGEDPYGPVDLDAVRRLVLSGDVGPDTYVWADGMDDWLRARHVPAITPPAEVRERLPGWT